jgi:putative SOS response-associated peptidase YedK
VHVDALCDAGDMCGRYASSRRPEELVEELDVRQVDVRERLEPDVDVAPTKNVRAVISRPPGRDHSAAPVRRLRTLTWGLVPAGPGRLEAYAVPTAVDKVRDTAPSWSTLS